jgi:Caudovirus prohead protease.
MSEKDKKTFVLSDQSVNSYGFWVETEGIDLSEFASNPLMFYGHDWTALPIGRWENVRKEGERLLAEAVFDEDDEFAQMIARKVEKGMLKCCSIGFEVLESSEDKEKIKTGQRYATVTKSKLKECSICPIGSNKNAVRLIAKGGKRVLLSNAWDAKESGLKLLTIEKEKKMTTEEEKILALNQSVACQKKENDSLALQVKELQEYKQKAEEEKKQRRASEIESLIALAVEKGKIGAQKKKEWAQLLDKDFETAKAVLGSMEEKKQSLHELLETKKIAQEEDIASKSWRELDKEGKLWGLKEKDPESFKAKYRQEFGTEYIG